MNEKRIAIISGSKLRLKKEAAAKDYYIGSLFKKAYAHTSKKYDQVLILSAKYHVLLPNELVRPYRVNLYNASKKERRDWANLVYDKLKKYISKDSEIFFYNSHREREFLIEKLEKTGITFHTPLSHLSLGEQLRWYNKNV